MGAEVVPAVIEGRRYRRSERDARIPKDYDISLDQRIHQQNSGSTAWFYMGSNRTRCLEAPDLDAQLGKQHLQASALCIRI